jgi:hypothetical protein
MKKCPRCKIVCLDEDKHEVVCLECIVFYPPAIIRAANDTFQYVLKLKTGETIFFSHLYISGEYVTLYKCGSSYEENAIGNEFDYYLANRGLDVRIDQVVLGCYISSSVG